MADEELDDLDAFGDDGDDLDLDADLEDIMGGDLEDDGDDGGGDDNELDSFFEDLSSIEDLDEDGGDDDMDMDVDAFDDEPDPAPAAAAPAAAKAAPAAAPQAEAAEPKSGGGIFKKLVKLLVVLLVVGGSGFGAWWFWLSDDAGIFEETGQLEEELVNKEAEAKGANALVVEAPPVTPPAPIVIEKPKPKPKPQPKPKKVKKVKAAPGGKYLVQVASCTFDDCREQFSRAIRRKGFPVHYSGDAKKFEFIELLSRQVYSRPEADRLIEIINQKNKWAGFATVVKKPNGFLITMGTFPHLERAKEVKFQLEKLFPNEEVVFNLELVQKRMDETTKVFAGPFASKKVAAEVLGMLKTNPMFRQAFITRR
jgi:cell division septation protein DedD